MIDLSKIDLNKLDKLLQKEKGLALISLKELRNLINNQKKYLPIVDLTKKEKEIFDYVWGKKIIMGQPEGLVNTMLSVKYIINQNIPNREQMRFIKAHCQKKII